jgi:hypothetical protein
MAGIDLMQALLEVAIEKDTLDRAKESTATRTRA